MRDYTAESLSKLSNKQQLEYLITLQYAQGRTCCMYTPPSTMYDGRVYYVQEIRAKLPNGRIAHVEAMYAATGFVRPEEFQATELRNFKRLAFQMDCLVIEAELN